MDTKLRAQKLVAWIKERVLSAGCHGTVLGMSGGIDSSVVAVLCRQAFPQATLGIIMPCHSIDEDKVHAGMVASKFSIPTRTIALDKLYDSFTADLPDLKPEPALANLARANIKARLRMITLYYIANQMKYLVVGSGNRSELTIGYFTKHGDSGVDILPIGNLVKAEVRELARFLKIPEPIISKPPSAGLWAGQTDEAEMGITYDTLDRYILTGEAPEDVKRKIEARKASSLHKNQTPPIAMF